MPPQALSEDKNNYLASIFYNGDCFGFAICDFSTGAFFLTQLESDSALVDEINKFCPSEIIVNDYFNMSTADLSFLAQKLGIYVSTLENRYFDEDATVAKLKEQFKVSNLDGLGLNDFPIGSIAAGALLIHIFLASSIVFIIIFYLPYKN